jgi:hypothetical protein
MESPNQSTDLSVNENRDFKIYLISSSQTNKVYIGSTKNTLEQRFSLHKSHAKNTKYKCRSRVLINEFSDCKIDLIEYTTKEDRLPRERFWVEYYGDRAVNRQIPGRTQKEWYQQHAEEMKENYKEYYQQHAEEIKERMKEYNQQHAEEIKENYKEYYQQHAEEIKERMKEYSAVRINCECGTSYTRNNKTRHLQSKKHKDSMAQQQTQQ